MTDTDAVSQWAMTVHELMRWRDRGEPHLVVDVREPAELAICWLDQARPIPMNQIPDNVERLPRDRPIVVMCHHGIRSAQVVDYLRQSGLTNAVNLHGGIDAWAREVDPQMAVY
jgi:rhodanese-related sulfurtransferase